VPPVSRFVAALLPLLLIGCAASSPRSARVGAADSSLPESVLVAEIHLQRSAELNDSRGTLRVFDQDMRVEYRAGGRGPALDAGAVTLDGRAMRADPQKGGGVVYRLGRGDADEKAGGSPWMTLADGGGPAVPAASMRIRVAPFPAVTRPDPGQGVVRTEDLMLVMLPPIAEIWYRVTLTGDGDPQTALDMGEGRWVFPHSGLELLGRGPARVKIEVETSCGECPVGARWRATWSTRSELEVPLTLL
jgi:hypothetical protein